MKRNYSEQSREEAVARLKKELETADAVVIGAGMNTPVIIKYPFWRLTEEDPKAVYACLNYSEAYCPPQIEKQSVCIEGDCGEVIHELL